MENLSTHKYFCFEGPDYSGKSTLINLVCERLESYNIKFLRTREPGSPYSPVCTRIRDILQHMEIDDELVYAGLFDIDRRIHLKNVVAPAIKNDTLVLSDRCIISSMCYQEKQVEQLRDENYEMFLSLNPILFIIYSDKETLFTRSSFKVLSNFEKEIFNKRIDSIIEKYYRLQDQYECIFINNTNEDDIEKNVSYIFDNIVRLSEIVI